MKASKRSSGLAQSEIRRMSLECAKLNGINMAQGVCDLPLPPQLSLAVNEAMAKGINSYTRYDGLQIIREAIAEKLAAYNKINASPDKNITVSAGATGVFYAACMALFDAGDEVIVFEPYYAYHVNTLAALGIKARYFRLEAPDWTIDFNKLEKNITDNCKAILINTPGNPSGKVFSEAELKQIGAIAEKHDLFIISDEIYEYFIYDGLRHASPASIPELADRTITVSGYSKTFSITGWRIGYCVSAPEWADVIGHINDLIYVCAPAPLQYAVAKGINSIGGEYYEFLKNKFQSIRDKICNALTDAGLKPAIPHGAYYTLADTSSIEGSDSREKAMNILRKTGIASVAGSAFYHDNAGNNLVRFCFAKDDSVIDAVCQRLSKLKK